MTTPQSLWPSGEEHGLKYLKAATDRLQAQAAKSSSSLFDMLRPSSTPVVASASQAAVTGTKKAKTAATAVGTTPASSTQYKRGQLKDKELEDVLKQAGFKGKALQVAFGIAKRESSGNSKAYNGNTGTGDNSYGLFQINLLGSLASRVKQYGLSGPDDFFDPLTNAKVAYKMSKGGKDFGAWAWGPNAYRTSADLNQRVVSNARDYYGSASLL